MVDKDSKAGLSGGGSSKAGIGFCPNIFMSRADCLDSTPPRSSPDNSSSYIQRRHGTGASTCLGTRASLEGLRSPHSRLTAPSLRYVSINQHPQVAFPFACLGPTARVPTSGMRSKKFEHRITKASHRNLSPSRSLKSFPPTRLQQDHIRSRASPQEFIIGLFQPTSSFNFFLP